MSHPQPSKIPAAGNSTDRAARLLDRRLRARRRNNARQYDIRADLREVAPLLSARRVLASV